MCGIAGIISSDDRIDARNATAKMMAVLHHRGPDNGAFFETRINGWNIVLGHTRLAILDTSAAGNQPFLSADGNVGITYNGEVYNFRELRTCLQGSGIHFHSETDTEVIVESYCRWGTSAFGRLRGMYAFALLDARRKRLLLVRDPLSIKPLYVWQRADTLLFASEVRALHASGIVPKSISPAALTSFLRYGSVSTRESISQGVHSLEAGAQTEIDLSKASLELKTSLDDRLNVVEGEVPEDENEAIAHLHHLLRESVRLHQISDVPLGLFLSGGIDSTALLALMTETRDSSPQTFSVVFPEKHLSELEYAQLAASQFGAEHHEVPLTEHELLNVLPQAVLAMDQPTTDGINTFVIAQAVKSAGIKVALSGLGGDELFAGYPSFRRARLASKLALIPHQIRRTAALAGRSIFPDSHRSEKLWEVLDGDCSPLAVYESSRRMFSADEVSMLYPPAQETVDDAQITAGDAINEISRYELKGYMSKTLLRDTDFMSMAHSLEIRVPFIDVTVARYVLGLPGRLKHGRHPKPLLLAAMRGLVPTRIWKRKKMGFTLPFDRWMRSALQNEVQDTLFDRRGAISLGLNPTSVQQVWDAFAHRTVPWSKPWSLFVLMRWSGRERLSI